MTKKLEGRVAVVTGASSGIGEATALALANEGAKVVVVARRGARLANLSERIDPTGKQVFVVVADAGVQSEAKRCIDETIKKFGAVDILINNAGVMFLGPVEGANPDDWKRMFDINVLGLMYCTHAALPFMRQKGSGHIVNISSVAGRHVTARSAAYSATKFAVGAFSDGLRQEVHKHKIRVTVIEPGAVLTELTGHITHGETQEAVKGWVQNMQALTSEDIAVSIVYAVSQPAHVNVNEILIRPTDQA
jgi:NADP-dependent 3-hydroxy acid dehydrogenase YdfG